MRIRSILPMLAVGVLALSCGDGTGPDDAPALITELPRELTVSEEAVIAGSNRFALDLLREVVGPDTATNVFLSPLSASMALGMTMNGADGDTWTQMRDMLGFDGLTEAEINASYHDLIALLLDLDPAVTFGLGNSIWAKQGVPFEAAFYDRVSKAFGAELEERDFSDPATLAAINAWVDDVTNGRITELLDEIPSDVIMYLINAIFFEGDWRQQFDPDRTQEATFFRTPPLSAVQVPMMSVEAGFRTFSTPTAFGVELPYGGDAFTALAILPQGNDPSMESLVAGLDTAVWADWMARLEGAQEQERVVELPRFDLEYERTLNDDLMALGMADAFSEVDADFTRLTPLDLPAGEGPPWVFVSEVKQKAFLEVDEEGTTAAAATSVGVSLTSAPLSIRFDHPFLFAIRERLSGTILFIGVIGDPS